MAAADQREFNVTFPYLAADHVEVSLGSSRLSSQFYEWMTPSRIRLKNAPPAGVVVTIRRRTPLNEALVKFTNGSNLTEEELNTAVAQILYVQQELTDLYTNSLERAQVRLGDNLGVVSNPEDIADELAQMVLADELLEDLRARLADVNTLAEALIAEQLRTHDLKQGVSVIRDEVTEVKTETSEMASVLDMLVIKAPDGNSLTLREDTVYRGNGETFAQSFSAVQSNIGAVQGSVTELANATVGPEGAITKLRTSLGAFDPVGGGFILNDNLVKRTNGQSLAETFTGITSRLGNAEAAVVTTQQAVANETSARASAISGLQTQINGYSSSITTLQQVDAQLGARWGVALNANGHVSGVVMNNGGAGASSFDVVADRFSIVNPSNPGQKIAPFSVVAGFASFANPISVYKVGGSHWLIIGPGFGVSSNLVLWYGSANLAPGQATINNSIFCLTTDGQIKFPQGPSAPPQLELSVPHPQTATTSRSITVTPLNGTGPYTWRWTVNGVDENLKDWGIQVVNATGHDTPTLKVTVSGTPPPGVGNFGFVWLTIFCEDATGLSRTRSASIRFNGA